MSWPHIPTAEQARLSTQGFDIAILIGEHITRALAEGRCTVFIDREEIPELRTWSGTVGDTPLGRAIHHVRSLGYVVGRSRAMLGGEWGLRVDWFQD